MALYRGDGPISKWQGLTNSNFECPVTKISTGALKLFQVRLKC